MIAFINGKIDSVGLNSVIVGCGGLGYFVHVPASVLTRVAIGDDVKLLTHLQVKEDGFTLFGFLTQAERSVFLQLISISGVGAKSALSLLSSLTPEQLMLAVVTDDAAALSRAPGIGKKTAGRIILELKDKMRSAGEAEGIADTAQVGIKVTSGPKQDAMDALVSLGYSRSEAVRAVMEVYVPELNVEQTIKLALKKLS
ncbi:MAG: Holliday junction branch migration protein RuvA [Defluviitaleaceae bacterium]|nr:Holliday junction branch migration protein RuvA [Defluviitaleaceae bacterium]